MTAANCFLGTGAGYILTDAGTYSADGTILDICSKVECSDRLHLAIAASGEECIVRVEQGIYSPINAAFKLLEEAEDQADFLAKLPDAMRVYHGFMERSGYSGYFQFMVALWNKATNEPETYVIGSPGHKFDGLPPFTLAGAQNVSPKIGRWPSPEPTSAEILDFISEQRRTPWEDGTYRVGGYAELTTISEHGVGTERPVTWPDRIGRKINPGTGWRAEPLLSRLSFGRRTAHEKLFSQKY